MEWLIRLWKPQTRLGCKGALSAMTPKICETGLYPLWSRMRYEAKKVQGADTVILKRVQGGGGGLRHNDAEIQGGFTICHRDSLRDGASWNGR